MKFFPSKLCCNVVEALFAWRTARSRKRHALESLEPRRMLTALPNATLQSNHVLYVLGTTGSDTIEVEQSGVTVSVLFNSTPMTIDNSNGASMGTSINATSTGLKRVNVRAFTGNDEIIYDPSVTVPGVLSDGNGADTITSTGAEPLALNANGGNDSVTGGNGNYAIALGGGNDSIVVGNGNSTLAAYAPNDSSNVDNFNAGNGTDTVIYNGGIDNVTLGTGNDSVEASGDAVSGITVSAGSGNDFIDNPYSGNIDLLGTSGNDVVRIGGSTVLDLGSGNDLVLAEGSAGFDYVTGGAGSDTVVALQGNDTIDGTAGNNDELISESTTNTVEGSASSTIYGPATLGNTNAATYISTYPQHFGIKLAEWEAET